jgi:hypothetical protein
VSAEELCKGVVSPLLFLVFQESATTQSPSLTFCKVGSQGRREQGEGEPEMSQWPAFILCLFFFSCTAGIQTWGLKYAKHLL